MLPVNIKPIDTELVSSYLRRVAQANGTNLDALSYKLFNDSKLLKKDIDKYLSADEIKKISIYLNIPDNNIYNMLLYPKISKINKQDVKLFSKWFWVIPSSSSYKHKTNGLQFCPKCLEENINTFKIFNRLSFNIACEEHETLLYSHCPKCNYQYSPQLKQMNNSIKTCTNCNFDLSTIESISIDIDTLTLQTFLNNCITKEQIVSSPYPIIDKNIHELFFTIKTFISFIYRMKNKQNLLEKVSNYIDIDTKFNFEKNLGKSFETLSSLGRSIILKNVSILLKSDIEKLINIFRKSKVTYVQFLGSSTSIPHSEVTKKISNYLKLTSFSKITNKKKKTILPKSIEEVDKLMEELEQYI